MSVIVDNIVAIDELVRLLERRKLLFLVSALSIPQPFAMSIRHAVEQRSGSDSDSWLRYGLVFSVCTGAVAIVAFYSWFSRTNPDLVFEVTVRYFFVLLYFLMGIVLSFPFLPNQTIACGIPPLFWLSIHLFFIWRFQDLRPAPCKN